MNSVKSLKTEFQNLLKSFSRAYASCDAAAVLCFFADDAGLVVIGSGADEIRIGPRQLRQGITRDFRQSDTAAMSFRLMGCGTRGAAGWLSAWCTFTVKSNGKKITVRYRFSATLIRQRGAWKLVQVHLSAPAVNQQQGRSFPDK
jgi:ketosteroid isomerase-like protein